MCFLSFLLTIVACLQQLILDFLEDVVKRPTVLVGNSVGSLACVIAASGMIYFLAVQSQPSFICTIHWTSSIGRDYLSGNLFMILEDYVACLSDRIEKEPSPRACPVELCWWHEQQGHCRWLEDKTTLAAALVHWFFIEATTNCLCNFWAC